MSSAEQPRSPWRIFRYLIPYKVSLVIIVISMILFSALHVISLSAVVPVVDKVLVISHEPIRIFDISHVENPSGRIDTIKLGINRFFLDKNPRDMLVVIALFLLVVIVLKGIVGFIKNYLIARLGQKVVQDIRNAVYSHLQHLSVHYFTKAKTGELIARFTNDIALVRTGVTKGLCEVVFEPVQILFYSIILFFCEPRLALFSLCLIPVLMIPIIQIGKRLKQISASWQKRLGGLSSILHETITGIRIVKAFAMEPYEIQKFRKENRKLYKTFMSFEKRKNLLPPLMDIVGAIGVVGILVYGGQMVLDESLTKGQFLLFVVALISMLNPFKKLGKVNGVVQMMLAASERIYDVLDTHPEIVSKPHAKRAKDFHDKLEFCHVDFMYDPNGCILTDINFTVKKSEVVAFVGASGGGKTTILNLIPRFYDVSKGAIIFDGVDIRDLELSSLRNMIGMVTQDTILFNDTVEGNIAYGKEEWNNDELFNAAKQAHAHEFIENLPDGYQTVIGERGVKLSGGQKQRLAIARALMKNPPILILDEATSSLDTESEKLVQDAIDTLMKGRTVIAVAHRLSTIVHAHKIFVLDQGRIVGEGTHQVLIDSNPIYRKMVDLQFQI